MLVLSPLLSKASGSAGGLTAVTTRAGIVFRTRASPTGGPSPRQTVIRNRFATLASRWCTVLTQAQRAAWDLYASQVHRPNALGDYRNIGGRGMYIRTNIPRFMASASIIDEAPAVFALAGFTPITGPDILLFFNSVRFFINNTDPWARELGGFMLVYIADSVSLGTNFFAGTYRFAQALRGGTGPFLPNRPSIRSPFFIRRNTRIFWRVQVLRADGRYSVSQQVSAIAT